MLEIIGGYFIIVGIFVIFWQRTPEKSRAIKNALKIIIILLMILPIILFFLYLFSPYQNCVRKTQLFEMAVIDNVPVEEYLSDIIDKTVAESSDLIKIEIDNRLPPNLLLDEKIREIIEENVKNLLKSKDHTVTFRYPFSKFCKKKNSW